MDLLFFFFKYIIKHLWTYRRDTKPLTVHKESTQATTLCDLESQALKAENNYELNLLGEKTFKLKNVCNSWELLKHTLQEAQEATKIE